MTSNFHDYILESTLQELILEGEMKASAEFIAKLKSISKKSEIAQDLHDYFDEEYYIYGELAQNWIDVDGEDSVSFLPDKKAEKLLSDENIQLHGLFTTRGRSSIKIGRFLKAISKSLPNSDWSDKDIENFVNLYKSTHVKEKNKFKIIKEDDIKDWYNEECYADGRGTLGDSCMRDVPGGYFNLYSGNKACSLLIYIDGDKKLLGRALVWKLSESPCEAKYFMDRVYTNNDSDVNKFKSYADEKGWMYKYNMNSHCLTNSLFMYQNKPVFGKIEVALDSGKFKNYPFLDTLCFMNENRTKLSNLGFLDGWTLQSVDGSCEKCESCQGGDETCENCMDLVSSLEHLVLNSGRYSIFKKFFK